MFVLILKLKDHLFDQVRLRVSGWGEKEGKYVLICQGLKLRTD